MRYKFLTLLIGFIASIFLFLPTQVNAGGGLITFDVSPQTDLKPGEQFIVTPTVYADDTYTKKGVKYPIKIKFENPQTSDIINQSSTVTDENGNIYAKVISKTPGERVIYAEVQFPDGSTVVSSQYVLYYTDGPVIKPNLPQKEFNLNFVSAVPIGKKLLQEVTLSWQPVPNAVVYQVFITHAPNEPLGEFVTKVTDTQVTVTVDSSEDNFFQVAACDGVSCIYSSQQQLLATNKSGGQDPNFTVSLIGEEWVKGSNNTKRKSFLSWTAPSKPVSYYEVNVREKNSPNWSVPYQNTTERTGAITLTAGVEYYVQVLGCTRGTTQTECIATPQVYIPPQGPPTGEPMIDGGPGVRQPTIDELSTKIKDLESKVAQAEAKQAEVEGRLQKILKWLSQHIPFFSQDNIN